MDDYDDDKALQAVVKSMGHAARKAKASKLMPPRPKPAAIELDEMNVTPSEKPAVNADVADPDELSRILQSVLGK